MAEKLLRFCLKEDTENVEKYLSRAEDTKSLIGQRVFHKEKGVKTTCLHVVAGRGYVQLVKLFLQHGASVKSKESKYGDTPLHQAVLSSSETVVELLIDADPGVLDTCDDRGRTPLYYAAQLGHSAIVQLLVNHGADIEKHCKKNLSPLHVACYYGHTSSLKILLDRGANPNSARMEKSLTPLLTACRGGHISCVELLLDNPRTDTNCKTTGNWDPLHCAVSHGHSHVVKLLISRGMSSGLTSPEKWTALHFCSAKNHVDTIRYILEHNNLGHDINAQSSSGYTALHEAARGGSLDIVKLLIEHGAEIDRKSNESWTPLLMACHSNKGDVVRFLLKMGANVFQRVGESQRTCLHIAAEKGHIDVLNILLDHLTSKKTARHASKYKPNQLYVNSVNTHGRTPIYLASSHGHYKVVESLLKHHADPNITEHIGWTPLHAASRHGFLDVVEILLANGASVDARTYIDNFTSLHQACGKGHTEIVKVLLKYGANPDAREMRGWSALQISVGYGRLETLQALLETDIDTTVTTKKGRNVLHILGMYRKDAVYFDFLLSKGIKGLINQIDWLGNAPLHYVVSEGNVDLVSRLIEHGADVKLANNKGRCALMFGLKHTDVIKKLLENGAIVDQQDLKGMTCLHYAAEGSLTEAVDLLLESSANPSILNNIHRTPLHLAGSPVIAQHLIQQGVDVDIQDSEGQTPLHVAAAYRHSVVKVLLDNGISINLLTKKGQSALHIAAQKSAKAALMLIDRGIDVGIVDKDGFTALHYCAKYLFSGQNVIRAIIRNGANVDSLDASRRTPLHHACTAGNEKAVTALIEEGATVDVVDANGITPLMLAVEADSFPCLCVLLKHPVDINVQSAHTGDSALHVGIGSTGIVRLLIQKGADYKLRNKNGDLPLHCAARYGYSDTIEELCQLDNYDNLLPLKNNMAESPLLLALKWCQLNVVTLLLQHGALQDVGTDELVEVLSAARHLENDTVMDLLSSWFQCLRLCENVSG